MTAPARTSRPPLRWRRLRWLAAATVAALPAIVAGPAAQAYWTSTDNNNPARAVADSLPTGATPTAAVATSSSSVAVDFARVATARGGEVTDYLVRRDAAPTGGVAAATFHCSWPVDSTLACLDTGVPGGLWYYTDTPEIAGTSWVGGEGARSDAVTTDSTPPTVTVTSITPPPNGSGYHGRSQRAASATPTAAPRRPPAAG